MLTHHVSTVQVFMTEEYNNFSMINGNRPLNERKIKRIISEIESGNDMLKYSPIQVRVCDDKLMILDGQHRFFISKKLNRPVYYILVLEDKTMQDIAKINSNVEKWTDENFINCYLTTGNKNKVLNQNEVLKRERELRNARQRLPTRVVDRSKKIHIRIDDKTFVEVDPGTDIEAYKRDYFDRKHKSSKGQYKF